MTEWRYSELPLNIHEIIQRHTPLENLTAWVLLLNAMLVENYMHFHQTQMQSCQCRCLSLLKQTAGAPTLQQKPCILSNPQSSLWEQIKMMSKCQQKVKLHFNIEEREVWIHVKSVLQPTEFILYGFHSNFKHKTTSNYYIYFVCKSFKKGMEEQINILR